MRIECDAWIQSLLADALFPQAEVTTTSGRLTSQ